MQNFNIKRKEIRLYILFEMRIYFFKSEMEFYFHEHTIRIIVEAASAAAVKTAWAEVWSPPTDRTKKLSEKRTSKSREYFNE